VDQARSGTPSPNSGVRPTVAQALCETRFPLLRVIPSTFRVLLFPFATIELPDAQFLYRARVETASIDTEAIGVRTRHIERLDAANGTEQVLRRVRVEAVGSQHLISGKQLEAIRGNDKVQVTRLAAYGAIALRDLKTRRRDHLESYTTTMTTSGVCDHLLSV